MARATLQRGQIRGKSSANGLSRPLPSGALRCRRKFLRIFPGGFTDPDYLELERGYKWRAHQQWATALGPASFESLLGNGRAGEVAALAVSIESRTNLLFSFEKMALRDAVRSADGARIFAHGLHDFLHGKGDAAYLIPTEIVLVLLAIPSILSNTYAGVQNVDPAARDAARGMGMTGNQVLFKVELPCALPLIMSGVRSATLQVIATTTIAAYVSLGGLGRYVFDGESQQDYPQMASGAVLVALLAMAADLVLAMVQRGIVSRGISGRYAKGSGDRQAADALAGQNAEAEVARV